MTNPQAAPERAHAPRTERTELFPMIPPVFAPLDIALERLLDRLCEGDAKP